MARSGVDEEYDSSFECRYDLLAEADVARVTAAVAAVPQIVGVGSLRAETDVAAGSDEDGKSRFRIFRLPGQTWTQAFSPWPTKEPFELARAVSLRLATRCIQVESTDHGWAGHALYDRGKLREISFTCLGIDLESLCSRFGVSAPSLILDQDQLYDAAGFFHSEVRPDERSGELNGLATMLGFWVDTGHAVWDDEQEVERLDLLYATGNPDDTSRGSKPSPSADRASA